MYWQRKLTLVDDYIAHLEKLISSSPSAVIPANLHYKTAIAACNQEQLLISLNAMDLLASHSLAIVRESCRKKFTLIKDELIQLKHLADSLCQFDPTIEADKYCGEVIEPLGETYWRNRGILSQKYEKAGDMCLAENHPLVAVQLYFAGYFWTTTLSLEKKLNITLNQKSASQHSFIDEDNPERLFLLGLQAQAGIGMPIHYETAAHYYRLAASQGHSDALWCLAGLCWKQLGGMVDSSILSLIDSSSFDLSVCRNKNEKIALALLHRSTNYRASSYDWKTGNPFAQYQIGYLYKNVWSNSTIANPWFKDAAWQGHAKAQSCIEYYTGSEFWLTRSAWQGYILAYGKLGYELHLCSRNQEALIWFQMGADLNDVESQLLLGYYYQYGLSGRIQIDHVQGLKWIRLAAEVGEARAQYYLGQAFNQGLGVQQNVAKAMCWLRKANINGVKNAFTEIKNIYFQNPEDLECGYYFTVASTTCLQELNKLNTKLNALIEINPELLLQLVLADDFLTNEIRVYMLLHIYEYLASVKISPTQDLLMWLGNYYFESLPNYHDEPDLQMVLKISAIVLFQQITSDSAFYLDAIESLWVLQASRSKTELDIPEACYRRHFDYQH